MRCIYCNSPDSKVVNSRAVDDGVSIRRRRECIECHKRFTTYERVEKIPFVVMKRNGAKQDFDAEKILRGVKKACEKRPIPTINQRAVADSVVRELMMSNEDPEIPSSLIGEIVMRKLKELDEVAYIRFACVHRQFKDINTFMSELRDMLSENNE